MAFDTDQATTYINGLDLSGTPREGVVHQGATEDENKAFDEAQAQALVVGSGVFSFAEGVDVEVREAISDSALLAQLVANKRHSQGADPLAWFGAYAEVLQNVGWTLQQSGWTDYSHTGNAGEVHEKILEVMTAALGPGAAALVIIASTINALKAMDPASSWLTIFSREAQKATIARFQVGLVSKGEKDEVFVSLLASLIEAESNITQVLFFKFRSKRASFKADTQKLSINRAALKQLGPVIRKKVQAYQAHYVSAIADLDIGP